MLFFLKFLKCLAIPSPDRARSRYLLRAVPDFFQTFFQTQWAALAVALCGVLCTAPLAANDLTNPPKQLLQAQTKPETQNTPAPSSDRRANTTIAFFEENADILDAPFWDAHGNSTTLRAWLKKNNKPVFLVLWATWCPPCIQEMPSLAIMRSQLKNTLDVLPIALDAITDSGGLKKGLQAFKLPLYTSPAASKIMAKYGMSGVPSFILLSPTGKDLLILSGGRNWADAAVQKELLDALRPIKAEAKTTHSKKKDSKKNAPSGRTASQG